jgi:hypothetical protein
MGDESASHGIFSLVQHVFGKPTREAEASVADTSQNAQTENVETGDTPVAEVVKGESTAVTQEPRREIRTPNEMAAFISTTLHALGCPEDGFVVTVYGSQPWNALLTITPAAGPVQDAALWRARVQDLAVRLRKEFDVSE